MIKARNIVITGFMGTGKTSVGEEVARRLGWEFVDMDTVLEERLGMTIADVFTSHGEASFREQERTLCRELADREGLVIATGGGTLIPKGNRQALGHNGLLICLRCEVEEILHRLEGAQDRPLLFVEDRRERIEELLAQRREAYDKIPYQIDTTELTVKEAADRVIALFINGGGR